MMRNLKVLAAAAMALASLGAFAVSARAAEEKFHCSVEPCRVTARQDGASDTKTGHQVLIVKDASGHEDSFTCDSVTAEATSTGKTATALIFENIVYGENNPNNCTINGTPGVTVAMNGCSYEYTSPGGGAAPGAAIHLSCPAGQKIEISFPNCIITIAGGQRLTGARYHNIGEEAKTTTEVTAENNSIKGITVTADGTEANCHINPGQTLTTEYLTGNVIATAETDPATGTPVMANGWWA